MPARIKSALLIYLISWLPLYPIYSQSLPTPTTSLKGLWVTQFKDIVLGNTIAENALLSYAQDYGFNYLICTNIFVILTEDCGSFTTDMINLQAFLEKAHTIYGIEFISGNVGSSNTAEKIESYNNCADVSAAQKFDMITYECEFYNSATNGSCPSYSSFIGQLNTIKTICETTLSSDPTKDLLCEVYIGGAGSTGAVLTYSSEAEMQEIASTADHVLLTYYRSTPSSSGGNFFNWTIDRLKWIASPTAIPNNIILLLKSRDTDTNNMYDYIHTYPGSHAEAILDPYKSWVDGTAYNMSLTKGYIEQFTDGTHPWLSGIKVDGFTWFEHDAILELHALPIELSNFEVILKSNNKAYLTWQTSSEVNNDWFYIERSSDAITWNRIDSSKGYGNASHPIDYAYIDIDPLHGTSYYRLIQKDYDGGRSFSEILILINNRENIKNVEPLIYPIPFSDQITIEQRNLQHHLIRFYSCSGSDLSNKIKYRFEGKSKMILYTSNLNTGIYFLKIGNTLHKIIK